MKSAIVLSGNVRTFLMPLRENPNARLCDNFINYIVNQNNSDVFVFTDTADFYFAGAQYFVDGEIEILDKQTCRLCDKVEFVSNDVARGILVEQLSNVIGINLKAIEIENKFNATSDPKYAQLCSANITGNNPALVLQQARKVKRAYEMLKQYELENGFKYDVILKWRFDNISSSALDFSSYDYVLSDMYVPGIHNQIIYDWYAFGSRESMDSCLSLYDYIGHFLPDGHMYICSCGQHTSTPDTWNHPGHQLNEITLSTEHHLFRLFQHKNIRLANAGYAAYPYRYMNRDTPFDDVMKTINTDATVIAYDFGVGIKESKYTK